MAKPTRRGVFPIYDTPYQFQFRGYTFYFPSMAKMKRFLVGKDLRTCSMMGKQMRKEAEFFNYDLAEYSLIMWYYECQGDNFLIERRDGDKLCQYHNIHDLPRLFAREEN